MFRSTVLPMIRYYGHLSGRYSKPGYILGSERRFQSHRESLKSPCKSPHDPGFHNEDVLHSGTRVYNSWQVAGPSSEKTNLKYIYLYIGHSISFGQENVVNVGLQCRIYSPILYIHCPDPVETASGLHV